MLDEAPHAEREALYRIAWRFRRNGTTGTGPWTRDRDRVEALLDSLSRRYSEAADHWVETAPAELAR